MRVERSGRSRRGARGSRRVTLCARRAAASTAAVRSLRGFLQRAAAQVVGRRAWRARRTRGGAPGARRRPEPKDQVVDTAAVLLARAAALARPVRRRRRRCRARRAQGPTPPLTPPGQPTAVVRSCRRTSRRVPATATAAAAGLGTIPTTPVDDQPCSRTPIARRPAAVVVLGRRPLAAPRVRGDGAARRERRQPSLREAGPTSWSRGTTGTMSGSVVRFDNGSVDVRGPGREQQRRAASDDTVSARATGPSFVAPSASGRCRCTAGRLPARAGRHPPRPSSRRRRPRPGPATDGVLVPDDGVVVAVSCTNAGARIEFWGAEAGAPVRRAAPFPPVRPDRVRAWRSGRRARTTRPSRTSATRRACRWTQSYVPGPGRRLRGLLAR